MKLDLNLLLVDARGSRHSDIVHAKLTKTSINHPRIKRYVFTIQKICVGISSNRCYFPSPENTSEFRWPLWFHAKLTKASFTHQSSKRVKRYVFTIQKLCMGTSSNWCYFSSPENTNEFRWPLWFHHVKLTKASITRQSSKRIKWDFLRFKSFAWELRRTDAIFPALKTPILLDSRAGVLRFSVLVLLSIKSGVLLWCEAGYGSSACAMRGRSFRIPLACRARGWMNWMFIIFPRASTGGVGENAT